MAKAKNKGRGFFRHNGEEAPAQKNNINLDTVRDSELDFDFYFAEEKKTMSDEFESAMRTAPQNTDGASFDELGDIFFDATKKKSVFNDTNFESLNFGDRTENAPADKAELFDITIDYDDEHEEKLDFDALGSFIDQQPQNRAAQGLDSNTKQAEDMSISFDEDETDVFPAAPAAEEDDGVIPEEQPVLRGRAKPAETIENFLSSLGLEYAEEEEKAEVEETVPAEPEQEAPETEEEASAEESSEYAEEPENVEEEAEPADEICEENEELGVEITDEPASEEITFEEEEFFDDEETQPAAAPLSFGEKIKKAFSMFGFRSRKPVEPEYEEPEEMPAEPEYEEPAEESEEETAAPVDFEASEDYGFDFTDEDYSEQIEITGTEEETFEEPYAEPVYEETTAEKEEPYEEIAEEEPESYAEEEISEEEPETYEEEEENFSFESIVEEFGLDFENEELTAETEPEETEVEEEPVEELEAEPEYEKPETEEEPESYEEEPETHEEEIEEEENFSFESIVEEFGLDFDDEEELAAETEPEKAETEEEPFEEPEYEKPAAEEEPETYEEENEPYEEAEESYSFESIVEEFGLDLTDEEEPTDETETEESVTESEADEEPEEDYSEPFLPAEPLNEYDFFAASDSEEEVYTEDNPADGFFDDDGEDDNYGLSEAQLRAIEHARELRESGFSFDYEPDTENHETVLAEELLGFDDSDDTPEEETVRPNIGIAYGVEEEDFGLAEEQTVKDEIVAPVLPEKKSFLNSVLGRFNLKKQPVYAEEEPVTEEISVSAENESDTEAYEEPAASADAEEGFEEVLPDEEFVEETAAVGAAAVRMAAGFSAAELAAAHAAELRDDEAQKTDYAEKREYTSNIDYDYNDPDGDSYGEDNTVDDFPSFREFVVADISALLLRIGTKKNLAASTIAEDNEELGPECRPMDAMRYYGSFRDTLRKRCLFAIPMLLLMVLMSLGLPLPGMLKNTATVAAALLAMQLTVMLIALDVVTNAIMNAVRGKIGADALAVIACIATSFDAILVIKGIATPHVPLCLFSSLSVAGILFSSMLTAQALRKTFRVPAIGKKTYVMTAENELTDKGTVTLLKSTKSIKGFVRRSEEAAPDEWTYLAVAPYLLIAVAVLSLIVTAITRDFSKFIYTFSAVLAPTVPFTALVCFAMPFFISAVQIFSSGAAIAGWSGANEIGRSREIVITDRDLFPETHVKIQDVRLFNDVDADSTVAYVGTIIVNSGSCLAPAFEKYMNTYGIAMRPVEGYEYLPGGGLKGIIDSNVVLLGNADMMRLMGIAVKSSLIKPNTIAIAVNNCLYGFIDVEYTPDDSVREALVKLMGSNRHPIFAIRDFNITPALIRDLYEVPTDGYDFPSYIERFRLSSAAPDESSLPAAILCTEGLAPLTRTANAGRSVYVATKANMWITAIAAVIGAIIAAVQIMSTGVVTVSVLAIFSVLMALPVLIISAFMKI